MKITGILILKDSDVDPVILGSAMDLSSFGYFQRGTVKEMIVFVSRTIAKRTPPGRRQSVEHEDYLVHSYNKNNLVGIVFANSQYPTRAAFSVINKVLDDFSAQKGESWRSETTDNPNSVPELEQALAKYQDPVEADKLMKIQKELDETKIILHKTIDSVLERGEKLDTLVEKSNDLSMASQHTSKHQRKDNNIDPS